MKVAVYIRVSTEEQNPQNQLDNCLTLVKGDYKVYEERQSAWKDDKERPIFENIKYLIKHGEIKDLVVWDWDRLFRNRKKLKDFFAYCKLYKCNIHSFRQKFFEEFYKIPEPFDEIMQELFINLLGWMAEDESKKKSERVKIAFKKSTKKWGRKPLKNLDVQILDYYKQGLTVRAISDKVYYWDEARNKKFVSKTYVHNIITKFKLKNS